MMHCRMCSQRLPRPGRLCRECEREIDRERAAVEGFAAVVALPGSSGLAAEGATSTSRSSFSELIFDVNKINGDE